MKVAGPLRHKIRLIIQLPYIKSVAGLSWTVEAALYRRLANCDVLVS